MSKRKKRTNASQPSVELIPPWAVDGQHRLYSYPPNSLPSSVSSNTINKFVAERSLVHKEYIREAEKTKRLGYGLSAGLLGAAVVAPLVAPEGREVVSFVTSGGLTVFAAGALGYSKLQITALKQKLSAEKK